MAGVAGRSGGHNRLSVEAHVLRGTFRPDRHARPATAGPAPSISKADVRRTLKGLTGRARQLAAALLASYDGWDAATLFVLRQWAASSERLETLQAAADADEIRKEVRSNLLLLKALGLSDSGKGANLPCL